MDPRLERFKAIVEKDKQKRAAIPPSREARILAVTLEKVTGHEAWDLYLAKLAELRQAAEREASETRSQILSKVRDPVETANLHARLHRVTGINSGLTMATDIIYNLIDAGKPVSE